MTHLCKPRDLGWGELGKEVNFQHFNFGTPVRDGLDGSVSCHPHFALQVLRENGSLEVDHKPNHRSVRYLKISMGWDTLPLMHHFQGKYLVFSQQTGWKKYLKLPGPVKKGSRMTVVHWNIMNWMIQSVGLRRRSPSNPVTLNRDGIISVISWIKNTVPLPGATNGIDACSYNLKGKENRKKNQIHMNSKLKPMMYFKILGTFPLEFTSFLQRVRAERNDGGGTELDPPTLENSYVITIV